MDRDQIVLGIYSYLDATLETIDSLKGAGYRDFKVFSPMPRHEFEEHLEVGESPVRFFAFFGAGFGAFCGLMITILTSMDWPLRVSAKPIVSLPPYMIIVFELTILFGALITLAGLLLNSRLRRNAPAVMYDPRFAEDRFGIGVVCSKEEMGEVESLLRSGGAEEVRFEGVR